MRNSVSGIVWRTTISNFTMPMVLELFKANILQANVSAIPGNDFLIFLFSRQEKTGLLAPFLATSPVL